MECGFFEGGINISSLVGNTQCFSTFLAETRSSTPFDATLKDFAGPHAFQTCGIEASKVCDNTVVNDDGRSITSTFTVSVKNNGFAAITNVKLFEDARCKVDGADANPTNGNIIAASLAAGATEPATVVCDTEGASFTNTVVAKATSAGSPTADDLTDDATATCSVPVESELGVGKSCQAVRLVPGGVTIEVVVDITVTNNGDDALRNITVTDNRIGTLTVPVDLEPGESYTFEDQVYTPTAQDSISNTDPNVASFTDTITDAQGTGVLSGDTVHARTPLPTATCFLCPPVTR
jgi:hypothetical protein